MAAVLLVNPTVTALLKREDNVSNKIDRHFLFGDDKKRTKFMKQFLYKRGSNMNFQELKKREKFENKKRRKEDFYKPWKVEC